jgi:hypothetical protein
MLYKTLIQKSHSLASGMTPSWHLPTWRQFLNSNYDKHRHPRLKLYLPRSYNFHALLNHHIKFRTLPCPYRDKRDHSRQFTHKTVPVRHCLRGWSHLRRSAHHLRGCPLAHGDSLPATCPKTTSVKWTQPTWPLPSETTIGLDIT